MAKGFPKKNIEESYEIAKDEMNYEERRFESIDKKSSTFMGFSSLLFILILGIRTNDISYKLFFNFGSFPISNLTFIDLGIFSLVISILLSLWSFWPRSSVARPRIGYTSGDLFRKENMKKSNKHLKNHITDHLIRIVEINHSVNETKASTLKYSALLSFLGIILLYVGFMIN